MMPPEGIRPIWLDGVVTSEYERDTLPLLFSSDEVFYEYYDALCAKHDGFRTQLELIKVRNKAARDMRAGGYWQECLANLSQCLHLRRCVFEDEDYQYDAALKHYVLSVLNFASFLLKESKGMKQGAAREQVLTKSFNLYKQAEEGCLQVQDPRHRAFFRASIASSLANYFFRRKRHKAGCQQASAALRFWGKTHISFGSSFFMARDATALCFRERYDEALRALSAARKAELDPLTTTSFSTDESFTPSPIRFNIQLLSNPMPVSDALRTIINHNMAVAMLALRRHKEAAVWCRRAMETANSNSQHLAATHPWVKAIKECQAFCSKVAQSHHFHKFKMKPSDNNLPEFQQMQKIIAETRTMPVFHSLLQMHRQQIRDDKEKRRKEDEDNATYEKELDDRVKANVKDGAAIMYGEPNREAVRPATTGHRRKQPLGSLRLYLKESSYRQFLNEYKAEKRAEKAKHLPHPPDNEEPHPARAATTSPLPPVVSPSTSNSSEG